MVDLITCVILRTTSRSTKCASGRSCSRRQVEKLKLPRTYWEFEDAVNIPSHIRICTNPLPLHATEIDLPEGHDVVVDDGEVDLGESIEAAAQEELKWNDPGLDLLLQREGGAPPASN